LGKLGGKSARLTVSRENIKGSVLLMGRNGRLGGISPMRC
jgi:hypothetical protein